MQKETCNFHYKTYRGIARYQKRDICICGKKRETYVYAERNETCERDLLSLDDMPEACPNAKETCVNAKRDVYTCKKRPVKETCKRDLLSLDDMPGACHDI